MPGLRQHTPATKGEGAARRRVNPASAPVPAKWCRIPRRIRSPGFRVILPVRLPILIGQWQNARLVGGYSCGAAPDSHRLPLTSEQTIFNCGGIVLFPRWVVKGGYDNFAALSSVESHVMRYA